MASTITEQYNLGRERTRVQVPAGEVSPPIYLSRESAVVVASPGSGGTMLAEATWSIQNNVEAGTAVWFPWDAGTVSAKSNQMLSLATAVRFTATTAAGVGEVSR